MVKDEHNLHPCACGCEKQVGKTFAQGHDSKLRSLINEIHDGKRPISDLPAIAVDRLDPCPDCNMPNVGDHRHGPKPKLAKKQERARAGAAPRGADEEEASESRLKGYFFGESWEKMPAKARAHLINVDGTWLSKARGGAIGAVLNDLQVAAEAMCHTFIWEPLLRSPGDQSLLPILAEARERNARGLYPTLSNCAWVCKQSAFRKLAQDRGSSQEEQRFLHSELPRAFNQLRKHRDDAQHHPERLLRREEVEPLVHSFLGVGGPGILRRLAEVGSKLSSKP